MVSKQLKYVKQCSGSEIRSKVGRLFCCIMCNVDENCRELNMQKSFHSPEKSFSISRITSVALDSSKEQSEEANASYLKRNHTAGIKIVTWPNWNKFHLIFFSFFLKLFLIKVIKNSTNFQQLTIFLICSIFSIYIIWIWIWPAQIASSSGKSR